MSKKVVIAGACRTAIGKMGGALSNTPAADLGAIVIKEALRRAGVKPEMVDEVKMGLCNPGSSGTERCTSGFYQSRTPNRSSSNHDQRCMWFWFEMCQ